MWVTLINACGAGEPWIFIRWNRCAREYVCAYAETWTLFQPANHLQLN